MTLATILPLLLTLHSVDGGRRSAEPSVVKVYDLTTALPGPMSRGGVETLLPFLAGNDRYETQDLDPMNGSDPLIDLLRSVCGDEFDYEGRSIHLEDNGRLIVQAPPAVAVTLPT